VGALIAGTTAEPLHALLEGLDGGCVLAECGAEAGETLGPNAAGEEPVMADAGEAAREDVEEEPAKELAPGNTDLDLLAGAFRVAGGEDNMSVVDPPDAMVGDGGAMGVAAEVGEHLFGAAEGALGVNPPVLVVEGLEVGDEALGRRAGRKTPQALMTLEAFEPVEELRAEDVGERFDREQEGAFSDACGAAIGTNGNGGNDDVKVGVREEALVPGVEDRGEAELAVGFAEALEGGGDRAEEEGVARLFVGEEEALEFAGKGEDEVEVRQIEQLGFLLGDPFFAGLGLALRAVAVAAGSPAGFVASAVGASVEGAAEGGGSTEREQAEEAADLAGGLVPGSVVVAMAADGFGEGRGGTGLSAGGPAHVAAYVAAHVASASSRSSR